MPGSKATVYRPLRCHHAIYAAQEVSAVVDWIMNQTGLFTTAQTREAWLRTGLVGDQAAWVSSAIHEIMQRLRRAGSIQRMGPIGSQHAQWKVAE